VNEFYLQPAERKKLFAADVSDYFGFTERGDFDQEGLRGLPGCGSIQSNGCLSLTEGVIRVIY
jgi:hypothetical protein